MLDIPHWLEEVVPKYSCPHCQKTMDKKLIVGIGVKNSIKYEDKTVFFFEYKCFCDNKVIVELDMMSVEDFVMSMVDEYAKEEEGNEEG